MTLERHSGRRGSRGSFRRAGPVLHGKPDSDQSLVEFALIAPLLLLLVFGIVKFGIAFNNYIVLTDAVRSGARQLAIERGQATPCPDAVAVVTSTAETLSGLTVTTTFPVPATSTCATLVSGDLATVKATYPCDLTMLGIDFAPGCTLSASSTVRVE